MKAKEFLQIKGITTTGEVLVHNTKDQTTYKLDELLEEFKARVIFSSLVEYEQYICVKQDNDFNLTETAKEIRSFLRQRKYD